ncbi:MAG: hypothetical protein DLM61_07290 [Pseudonocardiales bacterium]|nr:MAG: hypothetical protein DLM61_07290 [Pseudonocardiales bacterium]
MNEQGVGELQALLDDERVENIDINGCDEVWVSYAGETAPVRHRRLAPSDDDLVAIIQAQAAHASTAPQYLPRVEE